MFNSISDKINLKFSIFSSYIMVYFFVLVIIIVYTFFYSMSIIKYVNDLKQKTKFGFSDKVFIGVIATLVGLPPLVFFIFKYCLLVFLFKESALFFSFLSLILLLSV